MMMTLPIFRIEVSPRAGISTRTSPYVTTAHQLGITALKACYTSRLYFVQGNCTAEEVERLCQALLADPVTDYYTITTLQERNTIAHRQTVIEVTWLPGVTDPAATNLVASAHRLGIAGIQQAATGTLYTLRGEVEMTDWKRLTTEVFSNPVVQQASINQPIKPPFMPASPPDDTVEIVSLTEANDDELINISQERRLSLNLPEMQAVQTYYRQEGREPTDAELEMLAQTWSEHCVHKTFKATIDYTDPMGKTETIDGLLKTYIRKATEVVNKPWVRSAFVDNAGIVRFNDQYDLAFKVETHNHPSALEPFGGANTGVGGCIRDVLGVSARPIANTDILCFGQPDMPHEDLPEGVLHPRRIADGVIAGIEDYGNKMGIPTVNGAIVYHEGYTANPLVYCGCLGILPHGSHPTGAQAGDLIVALGGRTGRDGLRGATFSSMEMDTATSEIAGTAVQIGNPIQEKQVLEVVLRARDEQLYSAITDCGAGGFSSAVGEMGEHLGAKVQLKGVPLKYPGLRPWEIWLSEAQERMVLAVPPAKWERLQAIAQGQDVEATVLGTFENSGRLQLHYGDKLVGDLSIDFLHNGIPQRHMKAEWQFLDAPKNPEFDPPTDYHTVLTQLLAHPNIRSKENVVRLYDHEVQGGGAVKPFVGVGNQGPGDATVLVPLDTQGGKGNPQGVALSNGICPELGEVDPYDMAYAAIDEAVRNAVAVGADPGQIAILDNFCWGNPNLPDRLGALVRCAQGCHDAAVAYGTPFISGKDSLNNEYTGADGNKHAIPGTLLISAMGIVPDVTRTATMDLKQSEGSLLYIIGTTRAELGGSHYALQRGIHSRRSPRAVNGSLFNFRAVHHLIKEGMLLACHDCSEGGLAVALAEMAIAGRCGLKVDLNKMPASGSLRDDELLFAETISRFVVEVDADNAEAVEAILNNYKGVQWSVIGQTQAEQVQIVGKGGELLLDTTPTALEEAWRGKVATAFMSTNKDVREMPALSALSSQPKVLILHANGSNRDREAALACQVAGGDPEIVHMNQLLAGERHLNDYHMLVVPGGFSYGDDLGAGVIWASNLRDELGEMLHPFVESGRPVLGICNGFQALVKAGVLPGAEFHEGVRPVTLTYNERAHFECRWVYLQPNGDSPSVFTQGLTEPIYCPVAHGEGRFMVADEATAQRLQAQNLVALSYVGEGYPLNPNGSVMGIAGICNNAGNVLGLMPHPEDHIFGWQHPRWHRGEKGMLGLWLFRNGVEYAGR